MRSRSRGSARHLTTFGRFRTTHAATRGISSSAFSKGLLPTDWKPMASVGIGVVEIRVHTRLEHRVFYVAIELARKRLADLLRRRAQE